MIVFPKVSVVLPVYNGETTLEEALDSVLAQSLKDLELIVVDDGSTDATPEILDRWANRDSRIRPFFRPHEGVVSTFQAGIREATTSLIARMDADDRMHRDRLFLQKEYLDHHPEIQVVGSHIEGFPETAMTEGMRLYLEWQNGLLTHEEIARGLYEELSLSNPALMMRKETALAFGPCREGDFPEDYDMLLRMRDGGVRFGKIPRVLHTWRIDQNSLTRRDRRYRKEAFDRIRYEYLLKDPFLHSGRDPVFWGAGRATRRRSDILIQKGVVPVAYIDIDPAKIGNRIGGILVHSPEFLAERKSPVALLVFVRSHGATGKIKEYLHSLQLRPGEDYLFIG